MPNFLKLLEGGEHQHVDRKGPMSFDDDHKLELSKDIIAMANTRDGGTLIVGVSEDRESGMWQLTGITPEQARTFDITKVHDFVKGCASPPVKLSIDVVDHEGKLFVVIQIPEFEDQPHICSRDGQTRANKSVFRRGDILHRTPGAQSERISDESAMRQLLGAALRRRGDGLLNDISRLLSGASPLRATNASPWETARKLADLQSPRRGEYEALGSWTFTLHPDEPLSVGPDGNVHEVLSRAATEAQVSLRGWNFPHVKEPKNRKDADSGLSYLQDNTEWHDRVEATSVFENGFFQHERIMDEDLEARSFWGNPNPARPGTYLDWLGALAVVGEFSTFAPRLYAALGYYGRINFEIVLRGTAKRELSTQNAGRALRLKKVCVEPQIRIARGIDLPVLRADRENFAVGILRELYSLFHWTDPSEQMLRGDLQKLFSRRF